MGDFSRQERVRDKLVLKRSYTFFFSFFFFLQTSCLTVQKYVNKQERNWMLISRFQKQVSDLELERHFLISPIVLETSVTYWHVAIATSSQARKILQGFDKTQPQLSRPTQIQKARVEIAEPFFPEGVFVCQKSNFAYLPEMGL